MSLLIKNRSDEMCGEMLMVRFVWVNQCGKWIYIRSIK